MKYWQHSIALFLCVSSGCHQATEQSLFSQLEEATEKMADVYIHGDSHQAKEALLAFGEQLDSFLSYENGSYYETIEICFLVNNERIARIDDYLGNTEQSLNRRRTIEADCNRFGILVFDFQRLVSDINQNIGATNHWHLSTHEPLSQ